MFSEPDGLERFGGAFEVTDIPPTLVLIQTGRNPKHHEIAPATAMTMAEYVAALGEIVLVPTGAANDTST